MISKECPQGQIACLEANPCPRHIEYWDSYKKLVPQPPQQQNQPVGFSLLSFAELVVLSALVMTVFLFVKRLTTRHYALMATVVCSLAGLMARGILGEKK